MHTKNRHHNSQELHADLERIKAKARETGDAISHAAHDVKKRANAALHQSFQDAKEKTADLQEHMATYVRDNPVKAVGIAALAGFVISKLMNK